MRHIIDIITHARARVCVIIIRAHVCGLSWVKIYHDKKDEEISLSIKSSETSWRDTVETSSGHRKTNSWAMKCNVITSFLMMIIFATIFNNRYSAAAPSDSVTKAVPKLRKYFLVIYFLSFTNVYGAFQAKSTRLETFFFIKVCYG